MGLRGGFWKAAQLGLAAAFVLMGIYGGDMPLGALCASIVLGAMHRSETSGHYRAAANAALKRARDGGPRAAARTGYRWLAGLLTAWALLLVTLGRSTATLAGVLSACLALWLAGAGYVAARARGNDGLRFD